MCANPLSLGGSVSFCTVTVFLHFPCDIALIALQDRPKQKGRVCVQWLFKTEMHVWGMCQSLILHDVCLLLQKCALSSLIC